ncbi:MAG: peptidase MA family metallohydrolase, partial [Phycisphaerae bacterium]
MSLRDARSLLWRGHYLDAEKALASLQTEAAGTSRTALELNQIRAGLAEAQLRLGKYDQALETVGPVWTGDLATELVRARLQRLSGSYDAGMVTLKRLVTEHPLAPTPRLALAELQEYLGLREDAIETYAWFEPLVVDNADLKKDAAWLTDVAKGFYRYSVLTQENVPDRTRHVLQNMLQVAYGLVDRQYWPARLAAAELLREKYSNDETDGSVSDYKAALEINENLSEAHIGMGKIYLSRWDFESVDKVVEAVLAVNPKDVEGIRLKAAKLIIERRYPEAMEAAREALAINPRDLEALGILAGAAACRHDMTFVENVRQDFEKIAPRSSIFNRRLGDALGGIRQYAASEVAYLRAIERDPTDANVRAELGLMYMQWGDEGKARSALEGAWSLDQYNERSKNTLDLLDSLDDFDVHETDHFIIKYEQKRDPGLGEIFGHYLESIYQDLIDDYAFELQDKTIIEIFPTQPSFAVRITGKPWIHTVGACTGRVIAMASPRESTELSGPYNFASVLKHEFTHTVTLAATRNRIPHWFTEGLAVYQEDSARSFLWMRLLAEAIRRNELFTLESIDWGFIRPRRPTDRQMAYAQSEWMCEYIVERFGYDRINEMLALYREGKTQREVIEQILKISPESFSTDFAAWAERDASNWCFDLTAPEDVQQLRRLAGETPDDLGLRARLSRALLDSGDYE